MCLILSKSLLEKGSWVGWSFEAMDIEDRLMLGLIPHFIWFTVGHLLPSSHLYTTEENRPTQLGSEDVRAHVPAALVLRLPVTALVDVQGLSGCGVVQLLKPQCLVVVLVGAWKKRKEIFYQEEALKGAWGEGWEATEPRQHIVLKLSWYALRCTLFKPTTKQRRGDYR